MQIIDKQVKVSELTGNIQISYKFDNGFTGYIINNKSLTLRGPNGGIVKPESLNWVIANNLIKGE